jgi:3'(2'), 5'-bisphosphate nucleotidase
MLRPDERIELATEVVSRAALAARAVQANLQEIASLTKDDRSPVTVADYAVQAIVALGLRRGEQALIVGEESGEALRESGNSALFEAVVEAVKLVEPEAGAEEILQAVDSCNHDGSAGAYWTLDPVDGTKGFLRGQQYAISLGWIEQGRVTMGALACPNLPINQSISLEEPDEFGSLYVAVLGEGAWERWLNAPATKGTKLRRLAMADGEPIRMCESVEAGHSSHSDASRVLSALGRSVESVRLDSQCKYALVARSQADAYLRLPTAKAYVEKVWDHAAGMLVAVEAGAMTTDVTGQPLDFTHGRRLERNRGIVCTAPEIHGELIGAMKRQGIV